MDCPTGTHHHVLLMPLVHVIDLQIIKLIVSVGIHMKDSIQVLLLSVLVLFLPLDSFIFVAA